MLEMNEKETARICPITGSWCGDTDNIENCWNNCRAENCMNAYICESYSKKDNEEHSSPLQDSGARREFASGAVRDINEAKGRCDLLPLGVVGDFIENYILICIEEYIRDGKNGHIYNAIEEFMIEVYKNKYTALLELSIHYKDGAEKYSDRNWEKGIPAHCYVDSAVRHYLKFLRGDTDEPHDRAFLWNLFGLLWTVKHRPECNDLPFNKKETK